MHTSGLSRRLRAWRASRALVAMTAAACPRVESPAARTPIAARVTVDTARLSSQSSEIARFGTAPATIAPWRETWVVPARITLDPSATQTLGAISTGRVTRVLVRPGDHVVRGQVLVAIHSDEMMTAISDRDRANAAMRQATSALALASSAAARAERLFAIKALSQADLDRARAAQVDAQAARDQAAAEQQRATEFYAHLIGTGPIPPGTDAHEVLIRTTIDGTVVTRDATPGAVVLVGAPLVTVSQLGSLVLVLHVPEQAIAAATAGRTVQFNVPAYPDRRFEGQVTRVAPSLDTATRTIEVLATVQDPTMRLKPEMYATAQLLGAEGPPVLTVPSDAVQAMDGDTIVVTATHAEDGLILRAVRVHVGRRTPDVAEVTDGLSAGVTVVTEGAAVAKAVIEKRRGVDTQGT